MKKLLTIAILTLPLVLAGCPEEETPTPTDTGGTDTATDTGGTDTGGTDTGGTDTGADVPLVNNNYCMNDDDFAACENAATPGDACPDDRSFAQSEATNCGLGCVADADPRQCALDCLLQTVPLTNDCGGCYADIVLCSVNNCIPACLDASSPACMQCQADNCLPAFYACTGFESSCDDGADENADGNTDCADPSCEFASACTP